MVAKKPQLTVKPSKQMCIVLLEQVKDCAETGKPQQACYQCAHNPLLHVQNTLLQITGDVRTFAQSGFIKIARFPSLTAFL